MTKIILAKLHAPRLIENELLHSIFSTILTGTFKTPIFQNWFQWLLPHFVSTHSLQNKLNEKYTENVTKSQFKTSFKFKI